MEHKPLFGDLIAAHEGLAEEIKAVDVAADLALLLHHTGKSRADLARALGWSRGRVTQVLSGHENLTVQTIATVTQALGYTFDTVFRKSAESSPAQPWETQATLMPEVREMVSNISALSAHGPLLLPSLNFAAPALVPSSSTKRKRLTAREKGKTSIKLA
jgi:transcriptional regulator with XRE-family HTH domain